MVKWVESAIVVMGLLAGAEASAATSSLTGLHCTVVGSWACEDGQRCASGKAATSERYSFDLAAMRYQAPRDRGVITGLEMDDRGFMTFLLGGGRRYVHKNADDGDPMMSFLYLSPQDMRELRCGARYAITASKSEPTDRRGLAGHYYLTGVMETGSELLLRPDGSFAWVMSYGAADQEAKGKWRVDGNAVLLDAVSGAAPAFRQLRLRIEDGALLLNGAGKGRYERHP